MKVGTGLWVVLLIGVVAVETLGTGTVVPVETTEDAEKSD
jgi:hypothetical protein